MDSVPIPTHTILEKFEKGVPILVGGGRLGVLLGKGRPAPKPAPCAPPLVLGVGIAVGSMSLSVKPGFRRRPAMVLPPRLRKAGEAGG